MLKATQILVSRLVLASSVFTLAACGQTGALYLPARATVPTPPASVNTPPAPTTP